MKTQNKSSLKSKGDKLICCDAFKAIFIYLKLTENFEQTLL